MTAGAPDRTTVRPVLGWVPGYQRRWLRGDVLAGVTVTAYLVPQVMAYAELAGLPPVTGLWGAIGAMVVYALLGTSHQLSVGPESTTALMTAAALGAVATGPDQYAPLAVALCGIVAAICLLGRVAGLARISDLLSRPVLVGYMAGVAGIMVVSQLGKLTGLTVEGDGFVPELGYVVQHLDDVHTATLVLGVTTAALMILGARLWPRAPVALLGMLASTAVVALLGLTERGVAVVGPIPSAVPQLGLAQVGAEDVVAMLLPALGVAFVAYSDNILTARAFEDRDHPVNPPRELVALGAANLGAGLMQGFPVSSSGSRTAIAAAVGARSQLAGVATVLATVLAVVFLRPLLEAFPSAALGAVVVYAATRLVDVPEFRRFAAFRRSELVLACVTTASVLVVGVLEGIIVAIVLSLADLLRRVSRPHDAVQGFVPHLAGMHDVDDYPEATLLPGLLVYRYDSPLFFANAEDFRRR
ncbi:MAG TPA: SulP family inorganic anion transporter, partial [Nocardioides sp.]|uniref:SulP family inorganic anion transporter n=1 Tax=Nocardioides sp. TaxID=35761 RepID=UPI002C4514A1